MKQHKACKNMKTRKVCEKVEALNKNESTQKIWKYIRKEKAGK